MSLINQDLEVSELPKGILPEIEHSLVNLLCTIGDFRLKLEFIQTAFEDLEARTTRFIMD